MTIPATAMRNACECHDEPGHCTIECAHLVGQMSDGVGIDWYDPTGCSYPEPKPYDVVEFDAVNRRVVTRTVHPDDEDY